MPGVELTWLGHAAFRVDSPAGKRLYVDPWLSNPKCPPGESEPDRVDVIAITHGHGDHIGEAAKLGKRFSPKLVAIYEAAAWLEAQGFPDASALGMNKGGTVEVEGMKFSMTHALHSSGMLADDGPPIYLGEAAGYVVEFENGTKVYFAGDTAAFTDMQIIGEHLAPDVAVLPIGDHFTMGPRQAAVALELLGVRRCVPSHYGTFPMLTGTPDLLRSHAPGVEVLAPEPGETIEL
jgi:L-ascorbate metabolism protein UlaG (beta-lactamase superfamily)